MTKWEMGLAICKKCGAFEGGELIRKDRWKCPFCGHVQKFKSSRIKKEERGDEK